MQLHKSWIVVVPVVGVLALLYIALPRTGPQAAVASVQPARLEQIPGSNLPRVILTERAAQRIDVQTIRVTEEQVRRTRTVGADVIVAPSGIGTVRVRLDVNELSEVDRSQSAQVRPIGRGVPDSILAAEPGASTLPTEQPYLIAPGHGLASGQRVLVDLVLSGGGQRAVIPYSALLYDVKGDAWVYTSPEPLSFVRQPIHIDYIEGDRALLLQGPTPGTNVVTVGVAQLYGAETGVGK
jgi:hypothetical protein